MKFWIGLMALATTLGTFDANAMGSKSSPSNAATAELPPVQTVAHVDLERYLGKWFEIASIPKWFSKGCHATTAHYSTRADEPGRIRVVNECRQNSVRGELKVAEGVAKIVDPESNSKLKVSFFVPFYGEYWIIDLGARYEYAVVGNSKRNSLWILSRTPTIPADTYTQILARATAQGFDVSRLQTTIQVGQD